jgi:hypothetical protein
MIKQLRPKSERLTERNMTGDQSQNFNSKNKTNYFPGYKHKNKSDAEINNKASQ